MSLFYKQAFRTVFFFTGIKDKKEHRKNKDRNDVLVFPVTVPSAGKINVLTSNRTGDKKEPLLVDIHGGGWLYGDENLNLDFGKWFSQRGFKVSLLNYSLIYKKDIRGIIQELYRQLVFLKENAEQLNLDIENSVLVGDSAGAGLALQLVSISQSERLRKVFGIGKLPFSFKGLALYHPACYPKQMLFVERPKFMDRGARKTFLRMYCGKKDYAALESLADFSDIAKDVKTLPPTFVLTSIGDAFLKYQTDMLVKDFDRFGFPYTYYCVPDKKFGHVASVTNVDGQAYEKVNGLVLDFLKRAIN